MRLIAIKIFFSFLFFSTIIECFSFSNRLQANHKYLSKNEYKVKSFYKEKQDSILYEKYLTYQDLYKNKKYSQALRGALNLNNQDFKNQHTRLLVIKLIANIYNKTKNYKKAIKYYKLILNQVNFSPELIVKEIKDNNDSLDVFIAKTYLQIGGAYQRLHINELGNINNNNYKKEYKDTAIVYYEKLDGLNPLNDQIFKFKAVSYYNLSGIYTQDSLFEKAKFFALKAVNTYRKNNDNKNLSRSLNNLASIYLSSKDFNKAKEFYTEAIHLIENHNSQEAIKIKADLYYNLAWAMRNLKDYKAYDFQELSYEITDNQREKEIRKIIEEITVKHKENLEQQKIDLVKNQVKLEEAQEAKTSMLFGALSFLVLIVSGVIIYNYKLRQKNLRLKLSESKLIQQQNLEKVKSEAQVKILNATIDGKETERKLIAEILHDNVSALLSSANMHLTATKKQFDGDTPQEIEKTQAIISEASQKVRDLSHNLVSSILLKFGLEYAIKDVVKKYSNSQLKLDVSAKNINRYNQEFEIKIFNVIQELINNILKHSKAKHAQIDLKEENNQLTVLVKDDGVGFSTSSSSFSDGIGLNQVEARIHMMDGKLTIKSEVNVGTSIHIKVPILKKEKNLSKLTSVS